MELCTLKIDLKEALAYQILRILNATPYIDLGPIVLCNYYVLHDYNEKHVEKRLTIRASNLLIIFYKKRKIKI